ncbi:hypothetical protein [Streptomyces sp. CB01881]|uniref:hypothetical protein n=1 Tax=Streptomyces sp. CB01881 TaxID=2078691 RepID=UPI000CDCA28E|nr:hypothetical protein [Streptomyces sp. CB01881]AUY52764.1 hypothetical protein C2142_31950 [Streptomyces sp. CB01881]TYC70482.1 hypothetical protein EH183_32015 [Streptomyces sp. CB01881]
MKIRKIASGTTEMQLTCEDWQPEYAEPFRSGGCDGLLVGCHRPGSSLDLSFAPALPNLRSLRLGLGVRDPGPVSACHGLAVLHLGSRQKGRVDLSGLVSLTELEAPAGIVLESAAALPALESLTALGWRNGALELLGAHPRLRFLRIECLRNGEVALTGAAGLPELRTLWIYDGHLRDTACLSAAARLEEVRLIGAKTSSVEFAARLPHLTQLILENCGPLDSLAPLAGHPSLTGVALTGTTVVRDGDLRPFAENPRLRHVALEHGAVHYSHRPAEVRRDAGADGRRHRV